MGIKNYKHYIRLNSNQPYRLHEYEYNIANYEVGEVVRDTGWYKVIITEINELDSHTDVYLDFK